MINRVFARLSRLWSRSFDSLLIDFGQTLHNDLYQREKEFESEFVKNQASGAASDFSREFSRLNSDMMTRHSLVKRVLREYSEEFGQWRLFAAKESQLKDYIANIFRNSLNASFHHTFASIATTDERNEFKNWEDRAVYVVSKSSVKDFQNNKKRRFVWGAIWIVPFVFSGPVIGFVVKADPLGSFAACRAYVPLCGSLINLVAKPE